MPLNRPYSDVSEIGASPRDIQRGSAKGKTLGVAQAGRAYRFARIFDLAIELLGDTDKAANWMRIQHRYLGNERRSR